MLPSRVSYRVPVVRILEKIVCVNRHVVIAPHCINLSDFSSVICCHRLVGWAHQYRDHFVYGPSQWETTLHCNVVSHWMGIYTKWSLPVCIEAEFVILHKSEQHCDVDFHHFDFFMIFFVGKSQINQHCVPGASCDFQGLLCPYFIIFFKFLEILHWNMVSFPGIDIKYYRQVSNIRRTLVDN